MNIAKNLIFDRPFEEIELSDRSLNVCSAIFVRDINSIPPTKWVEPFFRICAEFQLVIYINFEPFGGSAAILEIIYGVMLL